MCGNEELECFSNVMVFTDDMLLDIILKVKSTGNIFKHSFKRYYFSCFSMKKILSTKNPT